MILGFTGTRSGMTEAQKRATARFLLEQPTFTLYNGACHGADRAMFIIALETAKLADVVFLPGDADQLAWALRTKWKHDHKVGIKILDIPTGKNPYMKRNWTIAHEADHLLATPRGPEVLRSGTWATIRRARIYQKDRTIISPDGIISKE